jgi:hypothetical protein
MTDIASDAARALRAAGAAGVGTDRRPRADNSFALILFTLAIAGICWLGWEYRNAPWLAARNLGGYYIGIVGSVMMVLLLAYPLRKRVKRILGFGRVATWFRLHMILGVLGPALIIVHSNYTLRSMNATVAFVSMLIVAGSGIIGRYLYGRIHRGLYGQKLETRDLMAEATDLRRSLGGDPAETTRWNAVLGEYERHAMAPTASFWGAVGRNFAIGGLERRYRKPIVEEVEDNLAEEALRQGWSKRTRDLGMRDARRVLDAYFASVRRAVGLSVNERLFSLWHVLHLPLFFMLIVAAIIHIVAVHLY